GEVRALATMQHPNVAAVYAAERVGPFHVLCMPYRGETTLAALLARARADGAAGPRTLVDTILAGVPDTTPDGLPEAEAAGEARPAPRRPDLEALAKLDDVG